MTVLVVVVPLAVVLAGLAVAAFVWAARTGQFDDLESPGVRVIFDEDPVKPPDTPKK